MNNNTLFEIEPGNLIYFSCKEFMHIIYLVRKNTILNKFKENISKEIELLINEDTPVDGDKLFEKINHLNLKYFYSEDCDIVIESNLIKQRVFLPTLSALKKSRTYKYIFRSENNKEDFNYRGIYEYQDELDIIANIFLMFYENNKNKMSKKCPNNYFIDIKNGKINNIYWGLAKVIRDCIAHDQEFTSSSGNNTFGIIENEEVEFFGVKKKILDFKGQKVKDIFTSIDFMIILYYLEQELK